MTRPNQICFVSINVGSTLDPCHLEDVSDHRHQLESFERLRCLMRAVRIAACTALPLEVATNLWH